MKRIALLFLCLLLPACLLIGCDDGYPAGKTLTFADAQLTLPGDFIDLSAEKLDADADFLYGWNTLIVKGAAEDKSKLQEMTLETYTAAVIKANGLETAPQVFGKGYRFTYETGVGDGMYTYITAVMEGSANFWLFQFYCPSENLQENQPEIDRILANIQVN